MRSGTRYLALLGVLVAAACSPPDKSLPGLLESSTIRNWALDEISGIQSGTLSPSTLFVHNDDGSPSVFALDVNGRNLGSFKLQDATNRDWEDITSVPSPAGPLLVLADIGDNFAQWDEIRLYFVAEPAPGTDGKYGGTQPLLHDLTLRYPDGARDCESLAYDSDSGRLLFISKRDLPPRIYGIDLETALSSSEAELQFLGTTTRFRAPSAADLRTFGARDGRWVSQPTGFDISRDGTRAAVISYRSLYLWNRGPGETWEAVLAREPVEFEVPPSRKEEAVSFAADSDFIMITTEGIPAPLYRFSIPPENL